MSLLCWRLVPGPKRGFSQKLTRDPRVSRLRVVNADFGALEQRPGAMLRAWTRFLNA